MGFGAAEDGDYSFDVDDEEFVVVFEFDGDGFAGVEEDFVVGTDSEVFVVFDLFGDGDDAAGDDGDFVGVGEDNAGLGLAAVFVLADDDAVTDGLDDVVFEAGSLGVHGGTLG